jgi:IS5 family transposase
VFTDLLSDNSSRDIWADSAYRSEAAEMELSAMGYRSHVHTKGKRNAPLSDAQTRANAKRSKVRARVEHVFGSIKNEQGGSFVRTIGLARAKTKVTLINLVYNMRRLMTLSRRIAPSF